MFVARLIALVAIRGRRIFLRNVNEHSREFEVLKPCTRNQGKFLCQQEAPVGWIRDNT